VSGYAISVVALITVFIAAIALRTIIGIARGQFRPAPHTLERPSH
jgi:hypothetical protein